MKITWLPWMLVMVCNAILLQSCCTKKSCTGTEQPRLFIKYKGFTSEEMGYRKIYVVDTASNNIVDSIDVNIYDTAMTDGIYQFDSITSDLRRNYYVVEIGDGGTTKDTISKIDYAYVSNKIHCNRCFPAGDGNATETLLKDFSFVYGGVKYTNTDTLTIIK